MAQTEWNADDYQTHAAFVPKLTDAVLQLLAPQAHETILDLGCGDGTLSQRIAESGCQLHAIDASPDMVRSARDKGIEAQVRDAQKLNLPEIYDAVFSNAALHWMTQPDAVITAVWNALKPGGRFVGELGGEGNIQTLVDAMTDSFLRHPDFGSYRNPWFFPNAVQYQQLLQQQGFAVETCIFERRPTQVGNSIRGWLEVFTDGITHSLSSAQTQTFYDEIETALQPHLDPITGQLTLDYMRLRFKATKPPVSN